MTTETVTDERYTRGKVLECQMVLVAVIAITGAMVLGYGETVNVWSATGCLALSILALIGVSGALAKKSRGVNYHIWRLTEDEDWWVLDDVDGDELVDGPVEVEVSDD